MIKINKSVKKKNAKNAKSYIILIPVNNHLNFV